MRAPRSSSASREQVRRWTSEASEAAQVQQKRFEASPKREDFEREFGKDRVKDERDGSWTLSLTDRTEIKKAHQMQEGSRKLDVERGAELQARQKRERVVRRDGRVIDLPEELVDHAKHRLRPAGRNGGAPSVRFGLSEAFGQYEQGPDGLWFVWNDGWEPTRLFTKGREMAERQRDPDGNVWVEAGGEWVLEGEVA